MTGILLAAGCGDDGGLDLADPPAPDDQSIPEEDVPGGETQADEAAAAADGFDECSLITPDEVAQFVGVDKMYITGRGASPEPGGGWVFSCIYSQNDVPGLGEMIISVYTEADSEDFFERFEVANPQEVSLGDHAERADAPIDGTTGATLEFRVVQDGQGVLMAYTYYGPHTDFLAPDDVMSGGLPETVLERIPEELSIIETTAEGPCANIDLAAASQVLGEDLTGERAVLGDAGAARCQFGGEEAALTVIMFTDPEFVADFTLEPQHINVSDLGDGAAANVYPDPTNRTTFLAVTINDGDRVVDISADYASALGPISDLRPEDLEMARAILAAIS